MNSVYNNYAAGMASSESSSAGSGVRFFAVSEVGRFSYQACTSFGMTIDLHNFRRSAFFAFETGNIFL